MKKLALTLLTSVLLVSSLAGCTSKPSADAAGGDNKVQTLKVGVTAGPHETIVKKVKEIAAGQSLNIEIVAFNEFVQPNIQLFEKQLDANIYQHEPYLNKFNADRKMNLVTVAPSVNFPMGIYSEKIKSVEELKEGDSISLPNDATNLARSLILLQSAGVIKLKDGVGVAATVRDIVENPKAIKFVELEAPMVIRSLQDVTAAVVNTPFAVEAGLNPVKDSIFIEDKDSPWVNHVVTRPELKEDERIKKLVEIYHSAEIRKFIEDTFEGSVVPGF
jgi:D-methionine transport system substrate-binding protein